MIWLARHGETDDNAAGRVQGSIDTPLNDIGRAQAADLAERVAPLGLRALHSSELQRALETATIIGRRVGLEPRVDERLAESRRGAWEGRSLAEIEQTEPGAWAAWQAGGAGFRYPGGESLGEHRARVLAALADVAAGPLPALVVSHGGSIRVALAADLHGVHRIPVPNAALVQVPPGLLAQLARPGAEAVTE